jgi:NitT/TauT family transport system substrate-binding protein
MTHFLRNKLFLLALLALALAACQGTDTPAAPTAPPAATESAESDPTPAPQELVPLRVVALPFLSFAPFYIAEAEGYYAEQGLAVELVNMTQTQEILPALTSGNVDLSSSLLSAGMFNTIQRGGQVQIVADKGYIDPDACSTFGVVASDALVSGGDVTSADYLRGKTMDVARTTWMEYYGAKELATVGLSLADMELAQLPSPAQPEALTQGTLDITTNAEPWINRMTSLGHHTILQPVNELLPDAQFAVVLYGPTLLGENREVGNRFMAAYLKAVRQYNEGKTDRNIEIVAEATQLDPELLRAICWPTLQDDGSVNLESVLDFQQWAVDNDLLEAVAPVETFWNPDFIDYANDALDTAD